jgi:signal transduction histidine kinase
VVQDDELKSANEKLAIANEKLLELDKQKDEFISIAAHELKTPLASISGFAQLLQKPKIPVDERQRYMQVIVENVGRLDRLVSDVVDSSRLSLGNLKMDIAPIDTKEVFSEMKETMGVVIKECGIKPVFKIENGIAPVLADRQRLGQVIRNLIVNATHYTRHGHISLIVTDEDDHVRFSVEDTGEGIPLKKQKYIFSKFFQADSGTERKAKGSGLGLSISKGLVEQMKGEIKFESKPGKGTKFFFTLPKA